MRASAGGPHYLGCAVLALAAVRPSEGFYLPGVSPHQYLPGERVEVKVNKLSSTVTQLPYDYYKLGFCQPKELTYKVENLGEVLHGSKIQSSPYELHMGTSDFRVLCKMDLDRIQAYPPTATRAHTARSLVPPARCQLRFRSAQASTFARRIREDYRVHMIMDNLPAATRMIYELPGGKSVTMYERGYKLGFIGSKEIPGTDPRVPYLNNHLRFIVKYHNDEAFVGSRIVG